MSSFRKLPTSIRINAMAKSYTEQLAEWVRQKSQSARHDRNRVAFLAVKDDVNEALDQGWPVKTIWGHMVEQKRIGFGYDTFLVYVKRYLRSGVRSRGASSANAFLAQSVKPNAPPARRPKESATPDRTVQAPHGQDQLPGFTFNAAPNREELI
jgi:hypothetical protein